MIIHDLTVAECESLLSRSTIGRLACALNNQPYIVPISYAFDQEAQCLYGFSTLGQKTLWMRQNPRVCVAVDEVADQVHWTSVVVTGRYQELRGAHEAPEAWRRIGNLFAGRATWWLPATARRATGEEGDTPVFYCIHIDRMSGRRTARPA